MHQSWCVQELAAIINANAHGSGAANSSNTDRGLGLYPALSMLNHSCRPNCAFVGNGTLPHTDLIAYNALCVYAMPEQFSTSWLMLVGPQMCAGITALHREGLSARLTLSCRAMHGGQGGARHPSRRAADSELHQHHRAAQDPGGRAARHKALCMCVRALHRAACHLCRCRAGGKHRLSWSQDAACLEQLY